MLAPLFERDGELHAVFTKRRDDLRLHAGQISFPGGRRDPADADLAHTALREAHEEIGLDPAAVDAPRRASADADRRHRLRDLPVRRPDRPDPPLGTPAPTRSRR